MTATDELRRMLDEHGVKWEKGASLTNLYTYWTDCNGHDVTAVGTDSVMFMSHFVTPAQAIEATLGRGECEIKERDDGWCCTGCSDMVGTSDPDSELYVSGNVIELWDFCPYCGRKVKR